MRAAPGRELVSDEQPGPSGAGPGGGGPELEPGVGRVSVGHLGAGSERELGAHSPSRCATSAGIYPPDRERLDNADNQAASQRPPLRNTARAFL